MKNTVLALGYFDAIHKGHRLLLNKAKKIADEIGGELLICTFGDDFYANLGRLSQEIFLLSERKKIFSSLGFNNLLIFDTSKQFLHKTKEEFLTYLMQLQPKAVVVGSDYRFGLNANGSIYDLNAFFSLKSIKVEVVDLLFEDNEKISTTRIKQLLSSGDIDGVNKLLGFDYFLTGKVTEGRQVGSKIGVPTANINICSKKLPPKAGVYVTKIMLNDKVYNGITNIGMHPTFNDDNFNIETHILDFNGNIYREDVTVYLVKYVREIIKFDTKEQLVDQINRDIIFASEVLQ